MITFETHFLIMLATLERSTPTEIGIDPNHGRVECSRFEIVDDKFYFGTGTVNK